MKRMRGAPFRKIKTLVIRPSEEITQVTLRHINEGTILSRAGLGGVHIQTHGR